MGIEVLIRELGPIAMIRFLQQYQIGEGNYTEERHQWLDKITLEDIAKKAHLKRTAKREKQEK
jgi:hypothetical protein